MGKSFEILGFLALNMLLGLILSVTVFSKSGDARQQKTFTSLTEQNVSHFLKEMTSITSGLQDQKDHYKITKYLMTHINDQGFFSSDISLETPDRGADTRSMEMNKLKYISHVLDANKSMQERQASLNIDHIDISEDKRHAYVVTRNDEKGNMIVPAEDGKTRLVPMLGTSYCEQKLALNDQNIIQMMQTQCSTDIRISRNY